MSRRDLSEHAGVWFAHGLTLAVLAVACAVIGALRPSTGILLFAGLLALGAVALIATPAPRVSTPRSHAAIASVYVFVGLGEVAFRPDWAIPLGAAMFIATLLIVRVAGRREIVAHLVAASVWLIAPAAAIGVDVPTLLMLVALVASVWTLSFAALFLLKACEAQGDKLQELLRVDPLTQVGNQRLLIERLQTEIEVHARRRQSFSIVALDLADFTGLNERLGREASDRLLERAATALAGRLDPQDTLTRPLDDEFWLLLPGADGLRATEVAEELRHALASVETGDMFEPALSAAVGIATYPRDGIRSAPLLDTTHKRLLDAQQHLQAAPLVELPSRSTAVASAHQPDESVRGLSRADLAAHPLLWRYTQMAYTALCALAAATIAVTDQPGTAAFVMLGGFVAVTVTVVMAPRPPATGTLLDNALLVSAYAGTAAAFWMLDEHVVVALTCALFVAPFIVIRATSRRATLGHLAGATAFMGVAAVALVASDQGSSAQFLQLGLVVPSWWSLAISCMLALEVAEEQGRLLEALVRTDHVTGVGNRVLLDDVLTEQLARSSTDGLPVSLVAVELVETYENSRQTSEDLLRGAAEAIAEALASADVLVRRRGHEFVAVIPGADPQGADHASRAIFAALAAFAGHGNRIECATATVSCPADAVHRPDLLSLLDHRLRNAGRPVPLYRP